MRMVSMLDCIKRVPRILTSIIENRTDTFAPLWETYSELPDSANEIVLIGSGTSYTGAFTAKYMTEKSSGVRVTAVTPNEFLRSLTVRNPNALYVFISQTGASSMTLDALTYAKKNGWMTAAISESAQTTIAAGAEVFLDMLCAYEEYPMRTIGYSATVLTVMLLGLELGRKRGFLSEDMYRSYLDDAIAAVTAIPDIIEKTMNWLDHNRRNMLRADCLIFSGAGALYGVALEGAVKVWETPQIISIGYELEEGLHGPNFGYNHRHCVVVLNDGGMDNDKAVSLCKYMKFEKNNGFIIGAGAVDEQDLSFECKGRDFCCLEFAAVVQVIAYRLAEEQGRDLFAPHDNSVMYEYFKTHN
jgi:glucosamine 6-phosphate synthetase-like amidotransferase/phosphosugar isomerase protein